MTDNPVIATRKKVQKELLEAMQTILCNHYTTDAIRNPGGMTIKDIEINLHLFERAGIVFEAVRALNGYKGNPRGFKIED